MPNAYHRGSVFAGQRRPLDREQRSRIRYLLNAHHRAGRLTRATRDVGEALIRRLGVDGQLDPERATIADDATCCVRTVARALDSLRRVGVLSWQRRIIRAGQRAAQTSSAYVLRPEASNPTPARPRASEGHRGPQIHKEGISYMPKPSPAEVAAAREALDRRRQVTEARLLGNGRSDR
jgi:hypothetical protein